MRFVDHKLLANVATLCCDTCSECHHANEIQSFIHLIFEINMLLTLIDHVSSQRCLPQDKSRISSLEQTESRAYSRDKTYRIFPQPKHSLVSRRRIVANDLIRAHVQATSQSPPQFIMNSLRLARAAVRARPAAFRAVAQRRTYAEAVPDKVQFESPSPSNPRAREA